MKPPASVYTYCDELDTLPDENRRNWLSELDLIADLLPKEATVLQVGSMDGTRILRLLDRRPDLKMTGIEIDAELAEMSRKNVATSGRKAHIVTGDVTNASVDIQKHQFILCLNNTLGYIPDEKSALANMRRLGERVIISVYGEQFTDERARAYFETLGLQIQSIDENRFTFADFTIVKRFTKQEAASWGGDITLTPLGYFCILPHAP